jgi:transcriptional regulator with XRE-family HTH domain
MTVLADYLTKQIRDRNLSVRAFALYVGVSHTAVGKILDGRIPDRKTFQKLADYLGEPVENLYRLAGVLPPDANKRDELIRLIEHLFPKLPEGDQQEIIEIIRMKVERHGKEQS